MKVIATRLGWYDNDRKRAGAIFEMEDKDYRWEQKADPKRGIEAKTRVCAWVMPFQEYQRILNERIANGWDIEEARDVETMAFDGGAVVKLEDAGPVASSAAARKSVGKKKDTAAQH